MQDLFTNKLPLAGKIKLSVARVSRNETKKKNGFHQSENQSALAGIRFEKLGFRLWFPLAEKNLQIKEYCFKQTENWFPLAGIENLFKNTFLQDEKFALAGISEKLKKIVANSNDKSFKQASL